MPRWTGSPEPWRARRAAGRCSIGSSVGLRTPRSYPPMTSVMPSPQRTSSTASVSSSTADGWYAGRSTRTSRAGSSPGESRIVDRPEIILAPGPTPIPPEVYLAQGSPLVYHRGPGFGRMLQEVTEGLQRLYHTGSDVLIFTSSGTGGLESAVANCFSPGDPVLVPMAGYFAERFAKIARAYGLDVQTIDYRWGEAVKAADVAAAMAKARAKAVLLTQSETSTGVVHDIETIARAAKDAGALVFVDAVSSLGAVPFDFDGWGIDVAISGSQKALSASPGLAFAAISQAAWATQAEAKNPRFYF